MKRPLEVNDKVRWTRYGDPKTWRVASCSGVLVHADSVDDPCLHATDHMDRFELLPPALFPALLMFTDVETTGLDPQRHDLLEMAYVLTTFEYPYDKVAEVNVCAEAEYLIAGLATDTLVAGGNTDSFITEMHSKSGLTEALRAAKHSTTGRMLTTLGRLEDDLLELSKDWPTDKDAKVLLAGNTVGFDLSFIRAKLPTFAKKLSHRIFDVSSQRLFLESIGMPKLPKLEAAHRARQDVEESMRTARACAEWVTQQAIVKLRTSATYGKFADDFEQALAPLVAIADAYDANILDDEARKRWGPNLEHENDTPPEQIELYSGRGGKELLTLAHCLRARDVVRGKP